MDNIRIEKIISAAIMAFFYVSALLAVRHRPKLQSCAILEKIMMEPQGNVKNPTLILNPIWGPKIFFQGFYIDNVPSYHPMQFLGKLMN